MKVVELVDQETGELEEYLRVKDVFESQAAAARKRQAYKEMREKEEQREAAKASDNRGFIKVMNGQLDDLNKELSLIDAGLLFRLSVYLRMESGGMLVAKKTAEGTSLPLKQVDLEKILGKKSSGVKKAVERLESLGVIRKEKQGRRVVFFINENLISIGKGGEGKPFSKVYKAYAKDMLANLTDREAGLILKMTAYVNYYYMLLTHNPTERDADKAKPLRLHEIADLLGVEEKYFTVLISNLKRKGAVATFDVGTKGKGVIIYPLLCDKGNDQEEVVKTVTQFFTVMR
jgi:DNA-binding MarR family transcriptional regulator